MGPGSALSAGSALFLPVRRAAAAPAGSDVSCRKETERAGMADWACSNRCLYDAPSDVVMVAAALAGSNVLRRKEVVGTDRRLQDAVLPRQCDLSRPICFFSNNTLKSLNSCNFHQPKSSAFLSSDTLNELCCSCSLEGSVGRMCWARGIRHRVRPQLPRQCEQNPPATHSTQGLSPFLPWPVISQHGAALWHVAPGCGRHALDTAPTSQSFDRAGKLMGRIRFLGGRSMSRQRGLPATLPRARVGFRLQPAPAAALADKPQYLDSSRVVCHSHSGPVRTGSPPSHQDHGGWKQVYFGPQRCATPQAPPGDHFPKWRSLPDSARGDSND